MEALARRVDIEPRLAYTAGLMRSIGKIALDRLTRSGGYASAHAGRGAGPLAEWETNFFGMNNCEVAAVILKEWRFPAATIAGISGHYLLEPQPSPLAQLLNLAAGAAERGGHGFPGETDYWASFPAMVGAIEVTADDADEALREALELFGPVRAAVG
jgi:HD-like signal output (HDOD) protein